MKLKKLILEMAAILLVATAAGLIWSYDMLHGVFSGKALESAVPSTESRQTPDIPLPAGLMQVKDFFDRNAAVIIDARDGNVFARGHIKGAVSLPAGSVDDRIADFTAKVPPATAVVIYCSGYGCPDSRIVGEKLTAAGYRRVFLFEGGYPEWKDAGFPVEGEKP